MRFGLYSEIQLHPGKTPEALFAEVLEQIENADRLGYDVYAVIEHFFFPKFSVSANPTALFAAAAQRTRRGIPESRITIRPRRGFAHPPQHPMHHNDGFTG